MQTLGRRLRGRRADGRRWAGSRATTTRPTRPRCTLAMTRPGRRSSVVGNGVLLAATRRSARPRAVTWEETQPDGHVPRHGHARHLRRHQTEDARRAAATTTRSTRPAGTARRASRASRTMHRPVRVPLRRRTRSPSPAASSTTPRPSATPWRRRPSRSIRSAARRTTAGRPRARPPVVRQQRLAGRSGRTSGSTRASPTCAEWRFLEAGRRRRPPRSSSTTPTPGPRATPSGRCRRRSPPAGADLFDAADLQARRHDPRGAAQSVGEDAFFALLRHGRRARYGNATTADFIALVGRPRAARSSAPSSRTGSTTPTSRRPRRRAAGPGAAGRARRRRASSSSGRTAGTRRAAPRDGRSRGRAA